MEFLTALRLLIFCPREVQEKADVMRFRELAGILLEAPERATGLVFSFLLLGWLAGIREVAGVYKSV